MIRIIQPTEMSFLELDYYGREEDRVEAEASHNMTLYEAAKYSTEMSTHAHAVYKSDGINDKLLCITGVVPYSPISDKASPWLLTTKLMKKYPRDLLKWTKIFLNEWKEQWNVLENYVDSEYEQALRWAKWSGFTVYPAEPYGENGRMFNKIRIERMQ